jgi:hypothetical protein
LFAVGPKGVEGCDHIPGLEKKEVHDDDDDDGNDAADDDNCDQNSYNSSSYVTISAEYLVAQKLGHKIGKFMENIILLFVTLS